MAVIMRLVALSLDFSRFCATTTSHIFDKAAATHGVMDRIIRVNIWCTLAAIWFQVMTRTGFQLMPAARRISLTCCSRDHSCYDCRAY